MGELFETLSFDGAAATAAAWLGVSIIAILALRLLILFLREALDLRNAWVARPPRDGSD